MAGFYSIHILFGRCIAQSLSFDVIYRRIDVPETVAAFTKSGGMGSATRAKNAIRI